MNRHDFLEVMSVFSCLDGTRFKIRMAHLVKNGYDLLVNIFTHIWVAKCFRNERCGLLRWHALTPFSNHTLTFILLAYNHVHMHGEIDSSGSYLIDIILKSTGRIHVSAHIKYKY